MLDMIKESADEHMKKAIESLDHNFASVRTGRANAMVLDRIKVDYYGVPTPVNQVAAVKSPDAHLLVIEPWEKSTRRNALQRWQLHSLAVPAAYRGTS